ncbi:MAG: hypothetical protein AAF740_07635 [Bacteroidota bacterium]
MHSDYSQPVNIGNPDEVTIKQFAEEVLELVGNPKAHLINKPLPQDDPKKRRPNITTAKEVLDWTPKVSRAEGLAKTIGYFRDNVKVD